MNYILIVIYNRNCKDSNTLCSILKSEGYDEFQLVVFDNSTIKTENREFCEKRNIIYYNFRENRGLSKAYNYVIDRLPEESGYLMIFDDDTEVPEKYLIRCLEYIEDGKADVLLPVIRESDTGKFLSPLNTINRKSGFQRLKSLDEIDYGRVSAINTGMTLSPKVYRIIRYNEELFLDCVDHDFMAEVRNREYKIQVMDCELIQHYSRNEQKSADSALHRFKIYKKDFTIYSKKHGNRIDYRISLLKHAVLSAIRYRDLRFFS